jgi:flagellar hook-basal body complex protein FliE
VGLGPLGFGLPLTDPFSSAAVAPASGSGGQSAAATSGSGGGSGGDGASFGRVLADALDGLNRLQLQADAAEQALAAGQGDVTSVVIAAEKAGLALQLAVALRNKAIEAYQQVMQMQV